MTQQTTFHINGPVKITIKGPPGSGKSQLAKAIADYLEPLNISSVSFDSKTVKGDRSWRKPYTSEPAKVMIIEKQGKAL